jgi:zona occludens toxin (predicted ATPase)
MFIWIIYTVPSDVAVAATADAAAATAAAAVAAAAAAAVVAAAAVAAAAAAAAAAVKLLHKLCSGGREISVPNRSTGQICRSISQTALVAVTLPKLKFCLLVDSRQTSFGTLLVQTNHDHIARATHALWGSLRW